VLCLPGLTRNSRDFAQLAQLLAEQRQVLTPDLRGRGRSDHDARFMNYQPATYADDVLAMLEQLAVEQVVVIGTSLGGLIAMLLATLRPGVLAGVVLNDIGPQINPAGAMRIARYVGRLPPVSTWDEAAAQAKQINELALPDFGSEDWMRFARCTYRDDGHGRPVLDMDPQIGAAMLAGASATPDLWPLFDALASIPTLLIRGATSDILSEATVAKMLERKPDLEVLVVPGRGHAPTLDEPGCRSAIAAFLQRTAPTAATH
ncbi:MAG: alpha/beta hydrolase, partial [Rhodobacteraceae bacterium]|nr:alpha/beta hydrolase [Paracoccaceae bacterium]